MKDLSQQPIIFTGKLNSLTRLQAQQLAAMLGAFPQTNMNQKIKYVIAGQIEQSMFEILTTKKIKYAETHSVKILNESEFLKWCIWRLQQKNSF
ncbi:BRCT domain-containing protein [Leuconostoc gasicomitatum]|uniref:BRCT domain-containing protein n=1 Tax=Leuconostoc gasicomitatum TaxID=115778 RepID=UPI001CC3468C|nr:BRCT domain-containing protein [Leuconostoc gasicomitatum]MBZ5970174.1 BRCT domain-containing protein [Leuconostoc gasicomitatum]